MLNIPKAARKVQSAAMIFSMLHEILVPCDAHSPPIEGAWEIYGVHQNA